VKSSVSPAIDVYTYAVIVFCWTGKLIWSEALICRSPAVLKVAQKDLGFGGQPTIARFIHFDGLFALNETRIAFRF
jgi:hypothetical protein